MYIYLNKPMYNYIYIHVYIYIYVYIYVHTIDILYNIYIYILSAMYRSIISRSFLQNSQVAASAWLWLEASACCACCACSDAPGGTMSTRSGVIG